MEKMYKKQGGFTLIESLIGIGIFVLLAGVVYQTFFVVSKQIQDNTENTTISNLASQYLEIARNIPYAQVGTLLGNPHGNLPDESNPVVVNVGTKSYKIFYEITYVDDQADGTAILGSDPAPNDYKQVKLSVINLTTNNLTKFVTNIVPTGLENMTSGGALSLSVIDAIGQPVSGASINITNTSLLPSINITRTSDSTGHWVEVGLPDSSNSYHITVTKNGYSKDQTYPISVSNPNPTKPDATIANGQVTQISFAIDKTSNLTFNTLNSTCSPISSVDLGIKGDKIIGTPNIYKYNNTHTSDTNGEIRLSNIEWDNYTPSVVSNNYMIYGSSPIEQINLLPDTSQIFNFILGTKTQNSLLVIVKDSSNGSPIEGATVNLSNQDLNTDSTHITGGSLWNQRYWNGGANQSDFIDSTKYWQDDGNINTSDAPLALRLANSNGSTLANSGTLISSTFDTGSANTTYTTFTWQPTSQDPETDVKFQVATNNDNSTWNFVGPDGTANTYYTTPSTTINNTNNNKRYIRYKAFLSTTNQSKNPTITSVDINYVSGCFTPGQVMFPGLSVSNNYTLTVSMPGYTTKTITDINMGGYQTLEVSLTPAN
jgi:prepilin-type N-terminal cleavage/methylation domain-containing protein